MAGGSLIEVVTDLSSESLDRYDDIIDVRSPAEFAEDHMPGAVNLPVLDNAERARVGTIYSQDSHFAARRIGAGLVAANIARHLEGALSEKPDDYRPLIYCWRGGMRSNAFATIASKVGWRCGLVTGGYQSWRRAVVSGLRSDTAPFKMVLIDGQTGTAKTEIIRRLIENGAQAVDLEGLAAHRGSVFGALGHRGQPSQKAFETKLWDQFRSFDPEKPVIAEAESSKIGNIHIPRRVWESMQAAPRIEITASVAARAKYLTTAYADLTGDADSTLTAIDKLRPFHSKARIAEWRELAAAGEHEALAASLIRSHYDPAYSRGRKQAEDGPLIKVGLDDLDGAELDRAVQRILEDTGVAD